MKLKKPPTIRAWLYGITGGAAIYPILVLFGLNVVDELDRTAFGVLVPNIRDAFGLNLTGLLALVGAVSVVALALQIPIASLSDRHNRVLITWVGVVGLGVLQPAHRTRLVGRRARHRRGPAPASARPSSIRPTTR